MHHLQPWTFKIKILVLIALLWAQKARTLANGSTREDMFAHQDELYYACAESQQAYQEVMNLTEYYNEKMAGGRWQHSMK